MYIYIYIYICIYTFTQPCTTTLREPRHEVYSKVLIRTIMATASFQKFNLEHWAQPLGDFNFQRACRSEHEQCFWDVRPSVRNVADRNREN